MPTLQANGMQLFYEASGSGEPLLLIGGFGCDHAIWGLVAPRLASTHRVIAFDNRCIGASSGPDGPFSAGDLAEDAAFLMDELGLERAHVAGHSMGGMIAQELALAHPERVSSLLLLSTAARCDARGKALTELFGELPRRLDPQTNARLIMPWLYTNAFYAKPGAVEQLLKLLLERPGLPTPEVIYHQSRATSAFDSSARLGAIRCPTIVLVGREDILLPLECSQQLARRIPNAKLVVLEETGHGLLIETPESVAGAMPDFLSKYSGLTCHQGRPMRELG